MISLNNYINKRVTFLILCLAVCLTAFAQRGVKDESNHMGYIQGFYYNSNNTCVDGLIRFEFDQDNYILFKSAYGSKGEKIKSKDLMGFTVMGDSFAIVRNFEIDSIFSRSKALTYKEGFAQVLETGEINLYKHRAVINFKIVNTFLLSRSSTGSKQFFTVHKHDADLFSRELSTYLNDEPELSEAIKRKELQFNQLRQIVKRYNNNFTPQN